MLFPYTDYSLVSELLKMKLTSNFMEYAASVAVILRTQRRSIAEGSGASAFAYPGPLAFSLNISTSVNLCFFSYKVDVISCYCLRTKEMAA